MKYLFNLSYLEYFVSQLPVLARLTKASKVSKEHLISSEWRYTFHVHRVLAQGSESSPKHISILNCTCLFPAHTHIWAKGSWGYKSSLHPTCAPPCKDQAQLESRDSDTVPHPEQRREVPPLPSISFSVSARAGQAEMETFCTLLRESEKGTLTPHAWGLWEGSCQPLQKLPREEELLYATHYAALCLIAQKSTLGLIQSPLKLTLRLSLTSGGFGSGSEYPGLWMVSVQQRLKEFWQLLITNFQNSIFWQNTLQTAWPKIALK